jgi:Cu(I)/Ag(I) efflux system membrane fusion protein
VRTLILLVAMAAAGAAGFGYGRWYAKPVGALAGPAEAERKPLYWVDPMHPWYKSDKPGTAPDCGMKLVPVYAGDEARYQRGGGVQISAEKQQLIGVEYGAAEYEDTVDTIHAAARVTLDETRIAKVQTRIEGWIEKVLVDSVGKRVEKGDPLFTIYSPEALATQQEYLLAAKAQHMMHDNPLHEMLGSTDTMLAAARKRLELWGISDAQVEQMAETGKPLERLTIYAPSAGFVMERNAFPGQHVTPDTALYTLADLSTVWVVADVFEYEAAGVHVGQAASLTMDSAPGRAFRGRVSYILPQVDAATRTLKVRIEFANPRLALKPDMYGQVDLQTATAHRLVVPQSAVLNSGDKQTVFVDKGNGYFEPREVKAGVEHDGHIEILSGLKAGERIVTSGNFLLDSESRLK